MSQTEIDCRDFLQGIDSLKCEQPGEEFFSLHAIASAAKRHDTYPYRAHGIVRDMLKERLLERSERGDRYRRTLPGTLFLEDARNTPRTEEYL